MLDVRFEKDLRQEKLREAQDAELASLRTEMGAITASVAEAESETASENHTEGNLIVVDGVLYRTTQPIVRGERVIEGINVTRTSVAEVIGEITKE